MNLTRGCRNHSFHFFKFLTLLRLFGDGWLFHYINDPLHTIFITILKSRFWTFIVIHAVFVLVFRIKTIFSIVHFTILLFFLILILPFNQILNSTAKNWLFTLIATYCCCLEIQIAGLLIFLLIRLFLMLELLFPHVYLVSDHQWVLRILILIEFCELFASLWQRLSFLLIWGSIVFNIWIYTAEQVLLNFLVFVFIFFLFAQLTLEFCKFWILTNSISFFAKVRFESFYFTFTEVELWIFILILIVIVHS